MSIKPRQPADILSELLVLQAQGGSDEALTQLVGIWTPRLKARALRLTRDSDGAKEVMQEAWIGIARGIRSLKDPAMFGAWSLRIVHHKAADWIKLRIKHRTIESTLNETSREAEPPGQDNDSHIIREAIGHLDRKLQDVVYLFYMDNGTIEQIAVALDIPTGTAKTRLARARKQLKHLLERSTQ
ncbi:MAG: RNA polymerase sigma factor [Phycisphaerales bacterium]|nr:RNA polymerase sigma factor [Phycisphaerales bacterium]